jgi:hypothetical protein
MIRQRREEVAFAEAEVGDARLAAALRAWSEKTEPGRLARWLGRELDADGVPRRLPVQRWWPALAALAEAAMARAQDWPVETDARIEGFLRATLRFSRPDGSSVFVAADPPQSRAALLRFWVKRLSDPGLETVARWWFPRLLRGRRSPAPPPLPAHACPDRPLAMLRADWSAEGDFLAIDQREGDGCGMVELVGLGQRWLGGPFAVPAGSGRARPTVWTTGANADLAEWTVRAGATRLTRSALLLRGRRLALLAEQHDGPGPEAAMSLPVSSGVTAVHDTTNRAVVLSAGRKRAFAYPLSLPAAAYATERGSFALESGSLVLRQLTPAPRTWLPVLVSWDPERNRRPTSWRVLTVSERGRLCPPGVAFAVRISWGRGETLLVYRSLGRPGLRACIGYQTNDRFVVGLFGREGDVEPLVNLET